MAEETPDSRNFIRLYELFTACGDSHEDALKQAAEGASKRTVLSVRINGPPQSGKTALLRQLEHDLKLHGYTCAPLSPRDHELRVLMPHPAFERD
jgi:stage III sporulation protein SpoIIIAA